MKSNNIKNLQEIYTSWSTEDLEKATTVEKDDYEPEAIALMHDELKLRVSQKKSNAAHETAQSQIAEIKQKENKLEGLLLFLAAILLLFSLVFSSVYGKQKAVIGIIGLWVFLSAIILARDTKRRTGRIAYLRVLSVIGIALFGAASRATGDYLGTRVYTFFAEYSGILLALWLLFVQPNTKAHQSFKEGVSLLKKGDIELALSAFNDGLAIAKTKKEKGYLFYNSAICNVRLKKHDIALAALDQAFTIYPSLKSKARKDKDFFELHNDEQFQLLFKTKTVGYECDKCGTKVTVQDRICPNCKELFE